MVVANRDRNTKSLNLHQNFFGNIQWGKNKSIGSFYSHTLLDKYFYDCLTYLYPFRNRFLIKKSSYHLRKKDSQFRFV